MSQAINILIQEICALIILVKIKFSLKYGDFM